MNAIIFIILTAAVIYLLQRVRAIETRFRHEIKQIRATYMCTEDVFALLIKHQREMTGNLKTDDAASEMSEAVET